jgi:hypothetical protein
MTKPRITAAAAVFLVFTSFPACGENVPRGFRSISLGMPIEEAKEALRLDPLFDYRGDPDVSFLPRSAQTLIECAGSSFVKRAYLQFQDGRLFSLILVLQEGKVDHFTMLTALEGKYGHPTTFSPREIVWQFEPVRFSLEKPLTVKYLDKKTFEALQAGGTPRKDLSEMARDQFVDQF